mmetsp:Transcript_64904/g.179997  ORF Transcript_64904/g.179997 Transcript_64904/m.179997 type:complete len:203 (-) Transcript_64904:269-877(-)
MLCLASYRAEQMEPLWWGSLCARMRPRSSWISASWTLLLAWGVKAVAMVANSLLYASESASRSTKSPSTTKPLPRSHQNCASGKQNESSALTPSSFAVPANRLRYRAARTSWRIPGARMMMMWLKVLVCKTASSNGPSNTLTPFCSSRCRSIRMMWHVMAASGCWPPRITTGCSALPPRFVTVSCACVTLWQRFRMASTSCS